MKKIQLIITSGIPGSGKTTWSKKMESENWIRVSTDDIPLENLVKYKDIQNRLLEDEYWIDWLKSRDVSITI